LIERLGLRRFLADLFPNGREKIRWADLALILVIARFCDPKSELYIAEHFYAHTALADLLHIPAEGSSTETPTPVRNIVYEALKMNAVAVTIFHNHVSGYVSPSPNDEKMTQKLKAAFKFS
jgi:hypothetical protein